MTTSPCAEIMTKEIPMADETRWSIPWTERPAEEARILNPAFCGELIGRTVQEYHRTRQEALGMVTTFLVLPLRYTGRRAKRCPGEPTRCSPAGWPRMPHCWLSCQSARGGCGPLAAKRCCLPSVPGFSRLRAAGCCLAQCGFRRMPISDSISCRSPIPEHADR